MTDLVEEVRMKIRAGEWSNPTTGVAPGYTQANLVILPKEYAYDFLLFCVRNPKACPLLEVTDLGSSVPKQTAPEADLRTDLPKYRIYRDGELVEEVTDITAYWQEDFVSLLIGCSFTFEKPLLENGIPIRYIEEGRNVSMYKTNIACEPAGIFKGPMVVSMRPMKTQDAIRAVQITSRFPSVHGAPIHIGDPAQLGIKDIKKPDFGDAVTLYDGEVPVFWGCGVTPQAAIMASKPELVITHAPGHMFITDLKEEDHAII
ncbi:putative hydro-lyase [Oceanobacillus piezotolerans]|uniref:Putative hydro-lyase D8M04_14840 n=1 Tax=Oceanobacillus piezotolerans TaxID=2448030 RepID=A0A498D8F8_9BACI|nr:putative hydro-lyase [Oceanobacillus piezotolerans]RLL42823.1 putative hydro-lyase [Oceanobacillus piezotolerans]